MVFGEKLPKGPIVQLESPFSPSNGYPVQFNIAYARRALRDSILRLETPFASHLLYTQDGVLDDDVPNERALGIQTGFRLLNQNVVSKSVIYVDYGISRGMIEGIREALDNNVRIEIRSILEDRMTIKELMDAWLVIKSLL
uniref:DUF7768 domain-containing protein n=1 Tax=Ochrobactrum phage ORM_20 TaxID=2985243 RepID=A0A9N6WS40_9VIRU|nr:hypothetical protein ORM20_00138 [Ochrobactrum phage ORM_20]